MCEIEGVGAVGVGLGLPVPRLRSQSSGLELGQQIGIGGTRNG